MGYCEKQIEVNGIRHWVKISSVNTTQLPIIIVHGGPGGFNYVFERVPGKQLEKHLNIIYYEQRGCGRSEKPSNGDYSIDTLVDDLHKLIKELGYTKVHLLGYSFGAELAVEYTLIYPETVEKLLLQCPSDMSDMEQIYNVQHDGIRSVLGKEKIGELDAINLSEISIREKYDRIWSLMDAETVNLLLFKDQEKAKWNRKLWEESGLINTGEMNEIVFGRNRFESVRESSKELDHEVLIIAGRHDKNVGADIPMEYQRNMKNSKMVVFENSAHFPDIEETEDYVFTVIRFVGE